MQDNKDNNNVNDIDNKMQIILQIHPQQKKRMSMKKYVMYVIVQKAGQAR